MMAAMVLFPTLQAVLDLSWEARALGVLVAGVMFLRYAEDWGRVYP
jgi:hypothetical protein